MKRVLPLAVLLLAGCLVRAQDEYVDDSSYDSVSVDTFGPSLDPYGAWVVLPGYGRAWQPSLQYVGADFYPYGTGGRWVYTNAGWVFDSEYPFGWAVFHYGRWYRDFTYGWLWIPGRTWGPSWVSWRAGGPYVGWAPLGPRGVPGYDSWCFVPTDRFTTGYPRRYSLPPREYHRAVAVTQPVQARRRVPVGPPPSYVSSRTRERIVPVPVTQVPSARTPPRGQRGRFSTPPRPPSTRQPDSGRFGSDRQQPPPPARTPDRFGSDRGQEFPPPPAPPGRFGSERREGGFSPPPVQPPPTQPRRERTQPSFPGPGSSMPQPQRPEQPRVSPPTFDAPPPPSSAPAQPSRPTKRSRGAPPAPPPPPRR